MLNDINKALTRKNMKQAELARMVGVKREYVNRIANYHITPKVRLSIRIARALGTTVENLWGGYI
jgi:putative transcriptional regulator